MREHQSRTCRPRSKESRENGGDRVERAGEDSFPASDPPVWTLSAARPDALPDELDAARRALKQQLRALCGQ